MNTSPMPYTPRPIEELNELRRVQAEQKKLKQEQIISDWKKNRISLQDAAGELCSLGWSAERAWAFLEAT